MSHEATNWAIKQRGLKPAAKVVLWHLCDRFHPDHGCFPSKETLAYDCEMSVRSVFNQIEILEEAGLLRVELHAGNRASGKFSSNRYILGCDPLFAQSPASPSAKSADGKNECPPSANSGSHRGQNLPTNTVSEPVSEQQRRGREAGAGEDGDSLDASDPVPKPEAAGSDLESADDVFEEFWEVFPKPRNGAACLELIKAAVADGVEPKLIVDAARAYAAEKVGVHPRYVAAADSWLKGSRWTEYRPAQSGSSKPAEFDDIAAFYAEWVNSDRAVPPSAIRQSVARELLKRELVTEETLRKKGVSF